MTNHSYYNTNVGQSLCFTGA